MAAKPSANRRSLLLSTFAGVLAGSAWGATIQALATSSAPTLSIIGRGDAQVVLIDTTRIRVLVLLGTPDDGLQAQIPALLTMLHQRVDILVGTSTAVSALGTDFRRRWRVTHTFLFPNANENGLNTMGQTWITQDVTADVGDGTLLGFHLTSRNEWNAAAAHRKLWMITIDTGVTQVALAPDQASVLSLSMRGAGLVVVPETVLGRIVSILAPASIATNSRDDVSPVAPGDATTMLVRIFPQDIARFELRENGIALPTWAEGSS